MKRARLVSLFLCVALLAGCDAFDGQYVRVTPHTMQPSKGQTETNQAENYTELRDILIRMAASGTESGVILVPDYPEEDLPDGLAIARRHVCNFDPIGSYALEEMSYEIGKKNGTPAVAVELTYRHSRSDIRGIVKLGSPEEVEGTVLKALENLDARKVLLVANYETLDIQQLVQNLSQTYPQSIMECPQTAMDTYGAGSSRVVELTFTYENSNDALRQMRTQVGAVFDSSSLYVSGDGADSQKFGQLYSFLMDRFHYTLETSITPAYSLLRHGVGDSRAFATVYAAMCRAAGLDCQIVTGTRDAEPWTWNLICDDGIYYHVDLTRCKEEGGFQEKPGGDMTGYVWDYSAYPD